MTAIPLDQLIGLVTKVRDSILADYAVDPSRRMNVPKSRCIGWVVPLLSYTPGGQVFEKPRGAFYFWQMEPDENNIHYQGCGRAYLSLLPRMPERPDQVDGLVPDIKPIVSISAGKYTSGNVGSFGRYATITPKMSGDERVIHYLPLMPLVVDILARFAKEMGTLPADLNWYEDMSHMIAA